MARLFRCAALVVFWLICPAVNGAVLGIGDCVEFREGGDGRLLKTPAYWVKGSVSKLVAEKRWMAPCPRLGKLLSTYSQGERVRLFEAMPCSWDADEPRLVDVTRVQVIVDSWETPWSIQHGAAGLLFRGAFMGRELVKGGTIDLDSAWLERCESEAGGERSVP